MEQAVLLHLRRHLAIPGAFRGAHLLWLRWMRPTVHARVRALLALEQRGTSLDAPAPLPWHEEAENTVATAPDAPLPTPDLALHPGERIGVWRIHSIIGQGGMGSVFRAVRSDGAYEQTVAIKCLRGDLATTALAEGFLRERSILANLSHPGIARLIDGGLTAEGTPWLAMELVEGQSIHTWCDQNRLDVRARVHLLLQVCKALGYAHREGVLHRDISPANLLVTRDGHVKLVDFGIAALAGQSGQTQEERIPYTEGYVAPEVRYGMGSSTASDLYSLGAVLATLLLGTPYLPTMAAFGPAPVSARHLKSVGKAVPQNVAALRGAVDGRRLVQSIGPDLYAVIDKCLQHDPAPRYASAETLHDDLKNWLRGRPVSARQGNRYRLLRFMQRNAVAATATVVAAFLLLGGGSLAWYQHAQRQQDAEAADALNEVFEATLGNATLSGLSGTPLAPRQLLQATEQRLRRTPSIADDPDTLARGLLTLARSYIVLGVYPRALALAAEAQNLAGGDSLAQAAAAAVRASLLNRQGRHPQAEGVARSALDGLSRFDMRPQRKQAEILLGAELASARWGQADHTHAMALIDRQLTAAASLETDAGAVQAELLIMRGRWRTELFQLTEARQDLERALTLSTHPDITLHARQVLVRTIRLLDQNAESYRLAKRVLADTERRYGPLHPETGVALAMCAESAQYASDFAQAFQYAVRAERLLRNTVGDQHPDYANALLFKSSISSATGPAGMTEALAGYRQAIGLLTRAHGPTHLLVFRAENALGLALSYSAYFKDKSAGRAEADESLRIFRELLRKGEQQHLPMPGIRTGYVQALEIAGEDIGVRKAATLRAMEEVARYRGRDHSQYFAIQVSLARILGEEGDTAAARKLLVEIVEKSKANPSNAYLRMYAIVASKQLGMLATRMGDPQEASRYFGLGISWGEALYGTDNLDVKLMKKLLAELSAGTADQSTPSR